MGSWVPFSRVAARVIINPVGDLIRNKIGVWDVLVRVSGMGQHQLNVFERTDHAVEKYNSSPKNTEKENAVLRPLKMLFFVH